MTNNIQRKTHKAITDFSTETLQKGMARYILSDETEEA